MSSLAEELAKSGNYPSSREIELELRARGYGSAAEWLSDETLRQRIDALCSAAGSKGAKLV